MGDRPKGLDLPTPIERPPRPSTAAELARVDATLRLYEQMIERRRRAKVSEPGRAPLPPTRYEQRQARQGAEVALIRDLYDVREMAFATVNAIPYARTPADHAALLRRLADLVESDVQRLLGYPPMPPERGPGTISFLAMRAALDSAGAARGMTLKEVGDWYAGAARVLWPDETEE